jgi:DNA replication licensing factor MCM6
MVRLSEALARLYCSDEIQPSYVREAYRLLKTSIIQVETSDVEVDDDDDDDSPGEYPVDTNPDGDEKMEENPETEPDTHQVYETQENQSVNPGEYNGEEPVGKDEPQENATGAAQPISVPQKKKKKTKISFEEYESITNAIAGHLRNLEGEDESSSESLQRLQWDQVREWYLSQSEHLFGDSIERYEEMCKKVNLVIRRLIDVDRILVTVGEAPKGKKEQGKTLLAVHPNYEVS